MASDETDPEPTYIMVSTFMDSETGKRWDLWADPTNPQRVRGIDVTLESRFGPGEVIVVKGLERILANNIVPLPETEELL